MQKHYFKKAALSFIEKHSVWFVEVTNWYVGITAAPDQRHSAHGSPRIWKSWRADHPDHARDLEKVLIAMGLKGAPGGGSRTYFIYVYKHSGPNS